MSPRTINYVVNNKLCTGCGTCFSICPNEAIDMTIDKKRGIYAPKIDKGKCNSCSKCYQVCPGYGTDFEEYNKSIFGKYPEDDLIKNYDTCYIGHSTNKEIRQNSSSGGLITQLLIFALEEKIIDGALVTSIRKNTPLEPEVFIARSREEIIDASKSKYCPVPTNIALKEILKSDNDEKFAFVGLPCHIQGIRKLEAINKKISKKIILHLGLVCNHTPTFLATEYILNKKGLSEEKVAKLEYRSEGWPGGMKITTKENKIIFIPHFSLDYWGLVFNSFFYPTRCISCEDKVCQLSDISFADAWTQKLIKKDRIGTSVIISRNQKSKEILDYAVKKGKIELQNADRDVVIQSQSLLKVQKQSRARRKVLSLIGIKIPDYGNNHYKPIKIGTLNYMYGMLFFILNYISSKRNMWVCIDICQYICEKGSQYKYKLLKRS